MNARSDREYSLWLVPEADETAHRRLRATITELAAGHEDAPVFEPHVTIFGGIDRERTALEEVTQTLAARTEPLELSFADIHWSTTRHRCVFLFVKPTLGLVGLHRSARESVDGQTTAYHPHLSLVYSEMELAHRRDVAQSIDTTALPSGITCQSLELVETTGPESGWETVVSVPLSEP